MVSSSPLSRDIECLAQIESFGAGAVVVFSLFEEQFSSERPWTEHHQPAWDSTLDRTNGASPTPAIDPEEFRTTPDNYLAHLKLLRETLHIPIIASLNVSRLGSWLDYARRIEDTGVSGIELDIYRLNTNPAVGGADIEAIYVAAVEELKSAVSIPVAVKLTPYFTNIAAISDRLVSAGADALVLFNRFYQPSIDIEARHIRTDLELSSPGDSRMTTLWIALLHGKIATNFAATGGMHEVKDIVAAIMAGADTVMLCSALLKHGVDYMGELHAGLSGWIASHGHSGVDDIRGVMDAESLHADSEYMRGGYAKVLNRYW